MQQEPRESATEACAPCNATVACRQLALPLGEMLVRFVKIDVQGDELRGMRRVLDESPDVCLLLECWPHGLASAGGSVVQFEAVLRAQGFRIHLVEGARIVEQGSLEHLHRAPPGRYWNVVAARTRLPTGVSA
jgi:hypothetical protein